MKHKRGRIEIIGEILDTINKGHNRKTRIMQSVYLNWRNFKEYMKFLLENELVEEIVDGTERYYELTEKGEKILENYREIMEVLKIVSLC